MQCCRPTPGRCMYLLRICVGEIETLSLPFHPSLRRPLFLSTRPSPWFSSAHHLRGLQGRADEGVVSVVSAHLCMLGGMCAHRDLCTVHLGLCIRTVAHVPSRHRLHECAACLWRSCSSPAGAKHRPLANNRYHVKIQINHPDSHRTKQVQGPGPARAKATRNHRRRVRARSRNYGVSAQDCLSS